MKIDPKQMRRFAWGPGDVVELSSEEPDHESFAAKPREPLPDKTWTSGQRVYTRSSGKTTWKPLNAKQEDKPGQKKQAKAKDEKPKAGKLSPDEVHGKLKAAMENGKSATPADVETLGKAVLGLKVDEVKALREKLGLKKGSGTKQKLADEILAKVMEGGGKKEEKKPEPAPAPQPEKKPTIPPPQPVVRRPEPPKPEVKPPAPAPVPPAATVADPTKENPFPPGSTRSKAWATLGQGVKDASLDPRQVAEKTLASLNEHGRDLFVQSMGIERKPGQSHVDAVAAHVAAQRDAAQAKQNASLPDNHVAKQIASSPQLKAKLAALSKLDHNAAHERRKQKLEGDLQVLKNALDSGRANPEAAAARLATLQKESDAVRVADRDEKARRAHAIKEVLKLPPEQQTKVRGRVVGLMSEKNTQAAKDGIRWLDGIVAKGKGGEEFPPVEFVQKPDNERAHYTPSDHQVNMGKSENVSVAIHEVGHGIESQMPGALKAALEFVEHRCAGEKPTSMKEKFGGKYKPHEVGRKDHFDRALDEHRAYYVGKNYGGVGSEILSMGLEALYADPVGFSRKDPEYCAFVMGILDGSLRKKPSQGDIDLD